MEVCPISDTRTWTHVPFVRCSFKVFRYQDLLTFSLQLFSDVEASLVCFACQLLSMRLFQRNKVTLHRKYSRYYHKTHPPTSELNVTSLMPLLAELPVTWVNLHKQ